jgi:peptide/nickel transport system substrate-binding protein
MSSTKHFWKAASLALIGALLLAACAPAATPVVEIQTQVVRETQIVQQTQVVEQEVEVVITATPEPFQPKGTLTVGLTTIVANLEQPYAPERNSSNASWTLFDSLVFPEPDGTFSPALAESWETSEDGRTVTFTLRQGVKFHNGEDFTADDVVHSWETYIDPVVTYASNWTIADSVEKVDDYTVAVSTAEPNALLMPYISTAWSIIPKDYYEEVGATGFAENPVGTGPFMLEEWVKGDSITVAANPSYWRQGYPKLEKVIFKFMPESATRIAAIQTGEIDISPRLTTEDAQGLLGAPDVQIIRYPVNRVYYLAFNNITTGKGTPIEEPAVRQALQYAVDVDGIITTLFDGFATRSVGFIGPGDLGFDNAEPIPYDPEQAKAMLAEAGYPNGFAVDMACPDGAYAHINEVCEIIRNNLNEVGVTGELDIMESNAYWELEATQSLVPLFVDSWSSQLTEAYPRLQGALNKGDSYANFYTDEIQGLLDDIATTVDVEERAALYGDIQQLMRDDPPFVYLYFPEAFEAVRTRVQNYEPRSAEQYYLWDVSVLDGE